MLTRNSLSQPELAATVTEYCTEHSNDVSENSKELWQWTVSEFDDADKMSSPLQGALNKFLAELLKPKKGGYCISNLGYCYLGSGS